MSSSTERDRQMPPTTLVVPCYNEAARLDGAAFLGALDARPWLRWHFVDDGSTDETAARLFELARRDPARISVEGLRANRGKAAAVHRGLQTAFAGDADVVGYWDADLAAPLEELDGMLEALVGADAWLVLGARVKLLGREIRRRPARHYVGRGFATLASLALGLPVYDTQCGAKLLRADAAAREILREPFTTRWAFDVELLGRLVRYDRAQGTDLSRRVVEYPLRRWRDVAGSKVRWRDGVRAGLEVLRIGIDLRRRR